MGAGARRAIVERCAPRRNGRLGQTPPADSTVAELSDRRCGLRIREARDDPPGLLERLRAGDARGFEELVTAYQHRVFGVALRMLGSRAEAEEVAQEVFLRAYRSIGTFRGDARLSTWLYAITSRLCVTRLTTGERRIARLGEDTLVRLADPRADPTTALERRELAQALETAIADLPEERRIVVILRDLEGLSYDEIAEALDLELNTVRSRLHRARLELKDKLEKFLP
jgi:RNA polymerase sigma-70 factor, ECF subfamily